MRNMMKAMMALLLSLMLILSLAACGGKDDNKDDDKGGNVQSTEKKEDKEDKEDNKTGETLFSQDDLDDLDQALDYLESLIPEGWTESKYGADIYQVWDEEFLPDCFPKQVEGVKVDYTSFKDYEHDTLNGAYDVGFMQYNAKEDYREYGVRFYATEAQLDAFIAEAEANGFVGGQTAGTRGEDPWWEFHFYNEDGWVMYIFFNTNDDEDGAYDGAASAYVTDSVYELPESVSGIPLPQKGMTPYDYNEYYCIWAGEDYSEIDFDLEKDTFPTDEYFSAWFEYRCATEQDAADYAELLQSQGWELIRDEKGDYSHTFRLKKDDVYAVSRYYYSSYFVEVAFANMEELLDY